MTTRKDSQKERFQIAIGLFVTSIAYIAFGIMTDDGSGMWVLGVLYFALPVAVIVGLFSLMQLRHKTTPTQAPPKSFLSGSISPSRTMAVIMAIIAIVIVSYIVFTFVDILLHAK